MIKINLIADDRRPRIAQARKIQKLAISKENLAQVLMFGVLALGLLVIGGRYFWLSKTLNDKKAEVATVQKEVDALAPIIREVEEFEAKKADLESKILVINRLRANQEGPVRIMDEISRALPEMLWLNDLQARQNDVSIRGQAFNTNAVANFLDNLDAVKQFEEPVLKDTRAKGKTFNFVIDFHFAPAAIQANDSSPAGVSSAVSGG